MCTDYDWISYRWKPNRKGKELSKVLFDIQSTWLSHKEKHQCINITDFFVRKTPDIIIHDYDKWSQGFYGMRCYSYS